MRLLKGLGYLLITVAILAFLIFGLNWNSFEALFRNGDGLAEGSEWVEKTYSLEGLVEYMALHPDQVSVVSYDIAAPDTGIYYRADQPHTMASLGNMFLAVAYAERVESGQWDPNETVSIEEVNQHYVPNIDRTTHQDALEVLREKGQLKDGKLSLHRIAATMIEYNDPTFADYLYERIGYDQLEALIADLGLTHTDTPLPFAGLNIAINPHVFNRPFEAHFDSLSALSDSALSQSVVNYARKYQQDATYRGKITDIFGDGNGLDIRFTQERDMYRFWPQSTARDLSTVMEKLMTKKLINKKVSERLWDLLNWPLDQQQLNQDLDRYGAIYASRMGILNGLDAGVSAYTKAQTVQTVFFDQLPVAFWLHMSSNYMHQDYQQRLIWDPALHEESKTAFSETIDSLHTLTSKNPS
jgi:hypothetical protein